MDIKINCSHYYEQKQKKIKLLKSGEDVGFYFVATKESL